MGDASFSRWNTLFYWICIYIYIYIYGSGFDQGFEEGISMKNWKKSGNL